MDDRAPEVRIAELYRHWGPSLLRYAATLTASPQTAEDLVQEAFLALQVRLTAGEDIKNRRAWTLTVVRNLAHKHHRRASKIIEMPAAALPAAPPARDTLALRELLTYLTEREQEVLLLRMESLGYREIGEELGIATGTVAALIARSLSKLREAAGQKSDRGERGETASR